MNCQKHENQSKNSFMHQKKKNWSSEAQLDAIKLTRNLETEVKTRVWTSYNQNKSPHTGTWHSHPLNLLTRIRKQHFDHQKGSSEACESRNVQKSKAEKKERGQKGSDTW